MGNVVVGVGSGSSAPLASPGARGAAVSLPPGLAGRALTVEVLALEAQSLEDELRRLDARWAAVTRQRGAGVSVARPRHLNFRARFSWYLCAHISFLRLRLVVGWRGLQMC